MRNLEFYTDGAFSAKSEMGGWASVCVEDGAVKDTQSGYEPYSTNNRMELMGFLSALDESKLFENEEDVHITIYTDSAYIANCFAQKWYSKWMANGWRTSDKQDVKNQDLWRNIVALYIRLSGKIDLQVVKVKSHSDNQWNNYADLLAVKARMKLED